MKNKRLFQHCYTAMFVISSITPIASSEIQGDRELLMRVIEAHKDNYERIRTWQGQANVKLSVDKQTGETVVMKAVATFVTDQSIEATRWQFNVESKTKKVGSENAVVTPPYSIARMLKEGKYYDFFPGMRDVDGQHHNVLVIWPQERYEIAKSDEDFNPMEYLNLDAFDVYERLKLWYDNPNKYDVEINRVGDTVKVERSYISPNMPETGLWTFQHEFDLAKGGNLKRYRSHVGSMEIEVICKWTYENSGGLWLPKTYSKNHRHGGDKISLTKTDKHVEFYHNVVNKPIDSNEFTLEKLGVTAGTMITDRVPRKQ